MSKEPTLGAEYLLPYEKGADSPADAVESLSDFLASDPEFADEAPTDEDEQTSEAEADDESEVEIEATEDEPEDEDESEDSVEEEPEPDPVYKVKVDGEELEVPLPELIKGYSRQADYTRKTTELANQRRAIEARASEISAARDEYTRKLELVEQALSEIVPQEPDWDAIRRDRPDEYAALYADYKRSKDKSDIARAELERERQKQAQEYERQIVETLQAESQKLVQAIPEWQDAKAADEGKSKLVDYAQATYGFTPDDLGSVTDHRLVLLLYKAMKHDEIQSKGQEVREKAKAAPVLKPGGRAQTPKKSTSKDTKQKISRLRQSGRIDDARSALEDLL